MSFPLDMDCLEKQYMQIRRWKRSRCDYRSPSRHRARMGHAGDRGLHCGNQCTHRPPHTSLQLGSTRSNSCDTMTSYKYTCAQGQKQAPLGSALDSCGWPPVGRERWSGSSRGGSDTPCRRSSGCRAAPQRNIHSIASGSQSCCTCNRGGLTPPLTPPCASSTPAWPPPLRRQERAASDLPLPHPVAPQTDPYRYAERGTPRR